MNEATQLAERLKTTLPDARVSVTEPALAHGMWWLDVEYAGRHAVVEWEPGKPFGITSEDFSDLAFGMGPEELVQGVDAACDRLVSMLTAQQPPTPTEETVPLAELRKRRGFSQQELAHRFNRNQAAVSKLERRRDMLISTLEEFAQALEADLELAMRFRDGTRYRIELGEPAVRVREGSPVARRNPGTNEQIRLLEAAARGAARGGVKRFLPLLEVYTYQLLEPPIESDKPNARALAWASIVTDALRNIRATAGADYASEVERAVSTLLTRYTPLHAGRRLGEALRQVRPGVKVPRGKPRVAILVPGFHEMEFISDLLSRLFMQAGRTDWLLLPIAHEEVLAPLESDVADVDAAVVFPCPRVDVDELRRVVHAFKKPTVFVDLDPFDGHSLPENAWFVGYSNERGAELAAEVVKRIVAAGPSDDEVFQILVIGAALQEQRQKSFSEWVEKQLGERVRVVQRSTKAFSAQDAGNRVDDYIAEMGAPPRVVFTTSDDMAYGAAEAIQRHHPTANIQVIGWDGNRSVMRLVQSRLSPIIDTVIQDRDLLAEKIVEVVERGLAGDVPPEATARRLLLEPDLASRAVSSNAGTAGAA